MSAAVRRNSQDGTGIALLDELLEILGESATLKLIESFGGTRLTVPSGARALSPDSPLVAALGVDAVLALMDWNAQQTIKVPLARQWRLDIYCARGLTRRQMARLLGVTEKTVYAMIARRSADRRQLSLSF